MLILLAGILLTGCTAPEPVPLLISDLQTDKVIVQADPEESPDAVWDKAMEGCAIHARTPKYIVTTTKWTETTYCSGYGCFSASGQSRDLHTYACIPTP